MPVFGHIATFFTFSALVLEVFSLISTTYNRVLLRDIYFAKIEIDNQKVIAGLWGYCSGTIAGGIQFCSKPKPAYSWASIDNVGQYLNSVKGVDRVFLAIFILYWIALGFTLFALLITLWTNFKRGPDLVASLITFLAFVIQTTVFVMLLVVSIKGINKAKGASSAARGQLGPSMWMTLGAFAALLLSSISYCFACIVGPGRQVNKP